MNNRHLPLEFQIYQCEKNKREQQKVEQPVISNQIHKSQSPTSVLIDMVRKNIMDINPNLQVQQIDLIVRDINEYRLLQSHRDALQRHAEMLAMKITQLTAPPPSIVHSIPVVFPPAPPPTPVVVTPEVLPIEVPPKSTSPTPMMKRKPKMLLFSRGIK